MPVDSELIEIAVGIVLTAFMYGLVPLCIALFRNEPIQKKTFRLICIGYTAAIALACAVYAFDQGETYTYVTPVLWGTIFYNIGVPRLKKRGLLLETPKKPKSPPAASNTVHEGEAHEVTSQYAEEQEYEQLEITVPPTVEAEAKQVIEEKREPVRKKNSCPKYVFVVSALLIVAAFIGGFACGKNTGYDEGWDKGYDGGYDVGHSDGYSTGYDKGKKSGYSSGYSTGYSKGLSAGERTAVSTTPGESYTTSNGLTVTFTDPIVYVTNTGNKYHRSWCSYLQSSHAISLSTAKSSGYTPCSRCSPPI